MKLKQIEDLATQKVSLWQPALLITLLLLGYFVVPKFVKEDHKSNLKAESKGSTLGVESLRKQLKPFSDQLKKESGTVLGLAQQSAQQTVQNFASKSAERAKEFVLDNTLGKVLQNIKALPADQQEYIQKAICK